ncbi:MAG: hypothetical protein MJ159_04450 [Treponemataceae bacterium]|nr:hypothetical protein [Treponemataceae bacterium]
MKKLIRKTIVLLIPSIFIILVFIGLNIAYKQTNHWKSQYDFSSRFNFVPEGLQLCNVGTSHGYYGLKWEDYPELNAFNFALSAQSFFMDLNMLKYFENAITPGAVVLIPLSYHQVYQYWQCSRAQYYYQFMNKKSHPFWTWNACMHFKLFPLISHIKWCSYIWNDLSYNPIERFSSKSLSEEEMKKIIDEQSADWFFNNEAPFEEASYQKNFDAVSALVDYCLEKSYRPVFITIPVYEYFNQAFDEIAPYQKKGFYKFSAELCEKYPFIPYWDYSRDEDFSPHIELFMDDDHLNLYGAEKFTARVVDDLRAAGYLQ